MANENWAEARRTAANLENLFSRLGSARQVFDDVLAAEKELATLLQLIVEAEQNAIASRGQATEAEANAQTVLRQAVVDIEAHEASVEVARQVALARQAADQEQLDVENEVEVEKVSATVRELNELIVVQTENRDNLYKEIEKLTAIRDVLNADLDVIRERIG